MLDALDHSVHREPADVGRSQRLCLLPVDRHRIGAVGCIRCTHPAPPVTSQRRKLVNRHIPCFVEAAIRALDRPDQREPVLVGLEDLEPSTRQLFAHVASHLVLDGRAVFAVKHSRRLAGVIQDQSRGLGHETIIPRLTDDSGSVLWITEPRAAPYAVTMSTAELPASTGEYLAARTAVGPGLDDCWLWTNKPDRDGYGVAHVGGKQWRAHRLSYRFHVGPTPDGHELDHTCDVRLCVRPSHLVPVASNFENFVNKYLRQGRTREVAEQLAAWNVKHIECEHELKVASRRTTAEAAERGIVVGARVVRSRRRDATIWRVTHMIKAGRGLIDVGLESEAGARTRASASEVWLTDAL